MSRAYGWRGCCSAADVPDVGVGSGAWFGFFIFFEMNQIIAANVTASSMISEYQVSKCSTRKRTPTNPTDSNIPRNQTALFCEMLMLLIFLPNAKDEPRPQLARHVRQHGA